MAWKLGQKPHHSPKPHQQQSPGRHTPVPSAKPQHLLGLSSLRRGGSDHHRSPLAAEWGGAICDTMCWSSLQGLRQGLPGGLCRKLPPCLWAEPTGPETAPTEGGQGNPRRKEKPLFLTAQLSIHFKAQAHRPTAESPRRAIQRR